jgi:NADH-quinone oxidoreductase subunit G
MPELADVVGQAENLIAFVGADGLTLDQQSALMKAVGNLLIVGGFAGSPNNGLIPVWPGANMQGAVDMGFSAEATASLLVSAPAMWVIAGADPVAEDVRAVDVISKAEFVVVCSQFLTPTAEQADVVLPSQSFAEREGTFTNGMRRVQRFYAAQTMIGQSLPDWKIFAHISAELGGAQPRISAGSVMQEITQSVPHYAGMTYPALAYVEDQFPDVGGDDLYYGGTAYSNHGGLGIQWPTFAENAETRLTVQAETAESAKLDKGLIVIPVQRLYDRGPLFEKSELMHQRIPAPYAELNSQDAANRGIADGDRITISFSGYEIDVTARVDGAAPVGTVLLPRRLSNVPTPLAPVIGSVQKIQE